ncbi:YkgJ family cysteine cluster protein [Candidatus Woesearchaeota archaeon]|nr:YkgJ family cysteine cluster protein [Candidatus Woesearchaeota archaeon]
MLTPQNFRCDRGCAECCKYLTVKLYKKDIEAIKKEGYEEEFFMEFDTHIKSPVLKLRDDKCVFLGKKKGEYYCRIYKIRPKVCRLYPFVNSETIESCRPELLKYRSNTNI